MPLNFFEEPQIEYTKAAVGYKFYNYAILHSLGVAHVFNVMRYNRAFFARASDVQLFHEIAKSPLDHLGRLAILLCKYDWRGKTKPNWSHQHLLSDQELQEITDPMELFTLNAEFSEWQARPTLKFEGKCQITGTPEWILDVMHQNRAVPFEESDARILEDGFTCVGESPKTIRVMLVNFMPVQGKWAFPSQT